MGIFEKTPSIRLDTEAFNKGLRELNLTNTQFNRKLKRLGISLGDPYSKTNYLNKLLRDAGKPELQYKNVISKNRPVLTTKGKVEVGMGGVEPGKKGAPENAKIWEDGRKVQKVAEKKFKNVTDQRKFFVDTMKKLYKNVPKSEILNLFKNVIKGIKSVTPFGIAETLSMQMMEDPEFMNSIGLGEPKQMTFNQGGMMDINEMTKPLGYAHGGFEDRMSMLRKTMTDTEATRRADMATGDPEMERESTFGTVTENNIRDVALTIARQQGDTSQENINLIIRQLMALTPSLEQTVAEETGYKAPKGLQSLMDKAKVMLGQKSDPMLRRDVGFERVR